MEYPTPEFFRAAAAHARQMADEYEAEGNAVKAEQRNADADHYELKAWQEEWRLAHKPEHKEAA